MAPNSTALVVILLLVAVGLIVTAIRYRPIAVKVACGILALSVAMVSGMAVVNDYYGYYQTWGQLGADLTGSYGSFAGNAPTGSRTVSFTQQGKLETVTFSGTSSKITRQGLVYLPPQYFEPRYAGTRFPVVELLHGTPGSPANWVVNLRLVRLVDRMLDEHAVGPMILVMPTMSVGSQFEECVDAPGALDDTYITDDVRADVLAEFRASNDPAQWGVAGYSSGGYCAANLALRHPADWGASGIMDGYFRPSDGPAAAALHHNAFAEAANDPLLQAARLSTDSNPLPSFWISAGTGDRADFAAATAFVHALHGVEAVTLYREPGAGHNFYAWEPAIPRMLAWMWTQLAPPALRVHFPIAGSASAATISPELPAPSRRPDPIAAG